MPYFISYKHKKGFGYIVIELNINIEKELKAGKPVLYELCEDIEKNENVKDVVILYFKRL